MYGTADLTIAPETARPATSGLGDIRARVAGIGALGFAGIVVLQNLIRGGSAPSNGASSDDVLAHYADHRALTVLLVSTFMIGGTALTVFLGGAMRRLTAVWSDVSESARVEQQTFATDDALADGVVEVADVTFLPAPPKTEA